MRISLEFLGTGHYLVQRSLYRRPYIETKEVVKYSAWVRFGTLEYVGLPGLQSLLRGVGAGARFNLLCLDLFLYFTPESALTVELRWCC